MALILEANLWIDGEGPFLAKGIDTYHLLQSIGYDAYQFRKDDHLITKVEWIKTANTFQATSKAKVKETKGKQPSQKKLKQIDKRLDAWLKD